MNSNPIVSIIINNYNYGRFLSEAIDSALNQSYPHIEVIVVDDGSTDDSCSILASYGTRIISILKENGGQASAMNSGVQASKGQILFFLDSDDVFLPTKVEEMLELLAQVASANPDVMISNYIEAVDEKGTPLATDIVKDLSVACAWNFLFEIRGKKGNLIDGVITKMSTPEQAYRFAARYRFIPYLGMPTSGFAMTRSLGQKIFPLPAGEIKTSADDFIVKAATLLGTVYLTNKVLTKYRIHGNNSWYGRKPNNEYLFFKVLDSFLNAKLESIGKRAVFSHLKSIHAKGYYRTHYGDRCSKELLELALEVIRWHVNLVTITFFVKTVLLAILFKLKELVSPQGSKKLITKNFYKK
jgi:glycosyltransferase involved in cell wall biosynthesis